MSSWQTTTTLLPHQGAAITKVLPSRVGGLFMEMGTGKSRTAIELAQLRQEKIDRVIWFCPVTVKGHIRREILKHTTCDTKDICVFDGQTEERNLPDAFWNVIGIESISSSGRVIFSASQLITDRTMVIVDESTYIKGHRSLRTLRITAMSRHSRYRLVLTGTPLTQGVEDLFAQMRFLSPQIIGYNSFYTFAKNHLVYSHRHPGQVVGSHNMEWLADRLKPYVYQVRKCECLDLPEKSYRTEWGHLSDEQGVAYKQAKEDFQEDIEALAQDDDSTGRGSSIAIFRLFSRLQAIACGFDGQRILPHSRLDLLADVLDRQRDSHYIIWTKYRKSIDQIAGHLSLHNTLPVYTFDGRKSETEREITLSAWRLTGGYLVATQSIGGHGIDLTESATVIFYSCGFKYSEHIQTEDRCHRIGQTRSVSYTELYLHCGIERQIQAAIEAKGNVLARFQEEIDKIKTSGHKERLKEMIDGL